VEGLTRHLPRLVEDSRDGTFGTATTVQFQEGVCVALLSEEIPLEIHASREDVKLIRERVVREGL
jgi:hypothetical protein